MSDRLTPLALFESTFTGVTMPAILVAENSQVLAVNERAAALFIMPAGDILGQRWAGLDANSTLVGWRSQWKDMAGGQVVKYHTDIETGNRYMRPINVEAQQVDDRHAILLLNDLIGPSVTAAETDLTGTELKVGYFSYNRVDRSFSISDTCRKMLELPPGRQTKDDLHRLLGQRMAQGDFRQLIDHVEALLTQPSQRSYNLDIETGAGTTTFSLLGRSFGNELDVTHISAIVRHADDGIVQVPSDHAAQLSTFTLEHCNDMIFWVKTDGCIVFANQTVTARVGYTSDELAGMFAGEVTEGFTPEVVAEFFAELRRAKRIQDSYVLLTATGARLTVDGVANYIRIGQEEYACCVCRDIDSEMASSKRRELMEFTFDQAEEMIIWSQPDGTIYAANGTYLEQTGFTAADLEVMKVDDIYAKAMTHEAYWERLRGGETVVVETTLYTAGVRHLDVEARMKYVNYEGQELRCVYLSDVSDDREKDRLLSLSKVALDTAADCILWLDNHYRVQYANEALLRLLPDPIASHIKGRDVLSLLPNLDRKQIRPGGNQDFDLVTPEGDVRHMNLTCSLLEHGGETFYVLSARDISTLAQERQELETAYTEIEVMRDRLRDENVSLREENETKYNVNNIITVSPKYRKILTEVGQVADVDTTVLITGETGTGKELLARAVHQLSRREDFPLIKVNCATLPENLIESELFGHEKGAFTGAVARKKGRFEMADRGTIFLDEIGELPIDLQAKLLRVLQEDEFERLGGERSIKVDVRLIAATNRDLEEMVRAGKFREDLYYRLNVFPIHNLPLRDRPEDIPVLIEYFTKKYAKRQGKRISRINSADIKRLSNYPFPGNIRELENIIERSVVLCSSNTLHIEFSQNGRATAGAGGVAAPFLTFEDMQRKHIIDALKRTGGRITGPEGAGVLLEVNDRTLVSKMRKLGIEKHEYLL